LGYGYPYEPTYGYYGCVLSPRGSSSGKYGSVLGHTSYQPSEEGPSTSVVSGQSEQGQQSGEDMQHAYYPTYYVSNKGYEPNRYIITPSHPSSDNTQEPGKVSSQLNNIPNAQRPLNSNAKNLVLVKPNPATTFPQSKGNEQVPGKKSPSVPEQPQQAARSSQIFPPEPHQ
ncbi:hypothetical protein J4Q44_G00178500, partial [Coregonus suidteri]